MPEQQKRRYLQITEPEPIRLTINTDSLDSSSFPSSYNHLKPFFRKVMETAAIFFTNALNVQRETDNIVMPSGTCLSYTVPTEDTTTGVQNSDLHIYFMWEEFGPDDFILGNAGSCARNGVTFRPIFGRVRAYLKAFELTDVNSHKDFEDTLKFFIHEMIHILGFTINSLGYFLDPSTNQPYQQNYDSIQWEETLRNSSISSYMVATPKLLEVAREHYGCSNMQAMQLENQSTSSGTRPHFERTILRSDIMSAQLDESKTYISKFAFALLEDSGHYKVRDYDMFDTHEWGRNKGCNFLTSCNSASYAEFEPNPQGQNVFGCDHQNLSKGWVMTDQFMDCDLHYKSGGYTLSCWDDANVNPTYDAYTGDVLGFQSMCLKSTVTTGGLDYSAYFFNQRCTPIVCDADNNVSIIVLGETYECDRQQNNCSVTPKGNNTSLSGIADLPIYNDWEHLCTKQTRHCENFCNSNGYCLNNKCYCGNGYAGINCTISCDAVLDNSNNCISQCPQGQVPNIATKICEVDSSSGSTPDEGSEQNLVCDIQCLTCSSTSSACDSCTGSTTRDLNNNCACSSGYREFNPQQENCEQIPTLNCDIQCNNCQNQSNQCDACQGGSTRGNAPSCDCASGYREYSPKQQNCELIPLNCEIQCNGCTGTVNSCNQCLGGNTRQNNSTCDCASGYREFSPKQQNCELIPLNCEIQCNGCTGTVSTCNSCQGGNTRQNNSTCDCASGYREFSPKQQNCELIPLNCEIQCNGCTGSISTCDSCQGNFRGQAPQCDCIDGYVDNGNIDCVEQQPNCNFPCLTCDSNGLCTACQGGITRNQNDNQCICSDGYYENNVSHCAECQFPCQNCSSNVICQSCLGGITRKQNSQNCECSDGYYENNTDNCLQCVSPCQNCSSINTCLSCVGGVTRKQNSQNCECEDGYYEINEINCVICQYPCEQCSSLNVCITCFDNLLRNNDCSCQVGSYETGSQCEQCSFKCHSCSNQQNSCDQCYNNNRDISNNCNCKNGFFEVQSSEQSECGVCLKKCGTCSDETSCDSCNGQVGRNNDPQSCSCQNGFYEMSPIQAVCGICVHPCLNCSDQSTCISCVIRDNAKNAPDCTCNDGYYENLTNNLCEQCVQGCSSCISLNECTDQNFCDQAYYDLDFPSLDSISFSFKDEFIVLSSEIQVQEQGYGAKFEYCLGFFEIEQLQQFGQQPQCLYIIDQNNNYGVLTIYLSYLTSFNVSQDQLVFKQNIFQKKICNQGQKILNFVMDQDLHLNQDFSQTLPSGQIKGKSQFSGCENVVLNLQNIINDGKRKIENINWQLLSSDSIYTNIQMINDKIQQNVQQIVIVNSDLSQESQNLVFQVQFQNFLGVQGSITKEISITFEQNVQSEFLSKFDKLNASSNNILKFSVKQQNCQSLNSENYFNQSDQLMDYQINQTNSDYSQVINVLKSGVIKKNYEILKYNLQKDMNNIGQNMYIQVVVNNQQILQQQLSFKNENLQVYIKGGSIRNVNKMEQISLEAIIKNINSLNSNVSANWNCISLDTDNYGEQCLDNNGQFLNLQHNQLVQTLDFSNVSIQNMKISVEVRNNGFIAKNYQNILIIQQQVVNLEVLISDFIQLRHIGKNEYIDVQVNTQNLELNQSQYQVQIIDNSNQEIVGSKIFYYNEFNFNLQEILIDNFVQSKLQPYYLKVQVKNAQQQNIHEVWYKININQPPYVSLNSQNQGIHIVNNSNDNNLSLQTQFDIEVLDIISDNQPLQYQFVYYLSSQQKEKDINNFQIIQQFSENNKIQTILPRSFQNDELIIGVFIRDQEGEYIEYPNHQPYILDGEQYTIITQVQTYDFTSRLINTDIGVKKIISQIQNFNNNSIVQFDKEFKDSEQQDFINNIYNFQMVVKNKVNNIVKYYSNQTQKIVSLDLSRQGQVENVLITKNNSININFDITYNNYSNINLLVCLQRQNDSEEWGNNKCKTIIQSENKIFCKCQEIGQITLIEDINYIYLDKPFQVSEDYQEINQISFIYLILFMLISGKIAFFILGYMLDNKKIQKNKYKQIQEDNQKQQQNRQYQEEEQTKRQLMGESNQSNQSQQQFQIQQQDDNNIKDIKQQQQDNNNFISRLFNNHIFIKIFKFQQISNNNTNQGSRSIKYIFYFNSIILAFALETILIMELQKSEKMDGNQQIMFGLLMNVLLILSQIFNLLENYVYNIKQFGSKPIAILIYIGILAFSIIISFININNMSQDIQQKLSYMVVVCLIIDLVVIQMLQSFIYIIYQKLTGNQKQQEQNLVINNNQEPGIII